MVVHDHSITWMYTAYARFDAFDCSCDLMPKDPSRPISALDLLEVGSTYPTCPESNENLVRFQTWSWNVCKDDPTKSIQEACMHSGKLMSDT